MYSLLYSRSSKNARNSLNGIRKGSALQRPAAPSIQNTSYISLNVTPLSTYRQQLTDISSAQQTTTDHTLDYIERRNKSVRQSKTTRTGTQTSRLLPQITPPPTRLEMNSLLHVSSLSTSLPPII